MEPKKVDASTAPKKRRIERVGLPNAPLIYANNIEVQQSNFDFRLRFGLVESATPEVLRVQDLATVYMSPQHAKSVVTLLAAQVDAYEKRFGPLKTVPDAPAEKPNIERNMMEE